MNPIKPLLQFLGGVVATFGVCWLIDEIWPDEQKRYVEAMKIGVAIGKGIKDFENDSNRKDRSQEGPAEGPQGQQAAQD